MTQFHRTRTKKTIIDENSISKNNEKSKKKKMKRVNSVKEIE